MKHPLGLVKTRNVRTGLVGLAPLVDLFKVFVFEHEIVKVGL